MSTGLRASTIVRCAKERLEKMDLADKLAVKKGYEVSATGMYLCEEFEV